jgi:hypothetical protein
MGGEKWECVEIVVNAYFTAHNSINICFSVVQEGCGFGIFKVIEIFC